MMPVLAYIFRLVSLLGELFECFCHIKILNIIVIDAVQNAHTVKSI